jgi:uroporphyrinogen decarboxylase
MTPRQRVITALTGGKPDRIPKTLGFFPQTLEAIDPTPPDDYFALDVRFAEFAATNDQDDFRAYLDRLPPDIHMGSNAQLQTYHEWNYYPEQGPERPLSRIRDLVDLVGGILPDLTDPRRHDGLDRQVLNWHNQELAVACSPPHLGGQLFETAWRMRGFDNFMMDLARRQSLVHYLLDQLTAMLIQNALIIARAGVDILLLDDDVAMPTHLMISPATWREFFKPRLQDVIHAAREEAPDLLVFYHSDGNFTDLIPDLIEIGVNVINPVQPDCMDTVRVKREFGHRVALWGTVGSAWLWDRGTPDQIRAEVRQCIETLGPEGLLLAPAYDVDYTPFENIAAFVEAAETFAP